MLLRTSSSFISHLTLAKLSKVFLEPYIDGVYYQVSFTMIFFFKLHLFSYLNLPGKASE